MRNLNTQTLNIYRERSHTLTGSESTAYASPIILKSRSVSLWTSSAISFQILSSPLSLLVKNCPAYICSTELQKAANIIANFFFFWLGNIIAILLVYNYNKLKTLSGWCLSAAFLYAFLISDVAADRSTPLSFHYKSQFVRANNRFWATRNKIEFYIKKRTTNW